MEGNVEVVNINGTNRRYLATEGRFGEVVWSPDSTEILTSHNRALYRINVSSGAIYQLPTYGPTNAEAFAWSPDGRWLLYRLRNADNSSTIYRIDVYGSHTCRLTDTGISVTNVSWAKVPLTSNAISATLTAVAPIYEGIASRKQIEATQTVFQAGQNAITTHVANTATQQARYDAFLATRIPTWYSGTATQWARTPVIVAQQTLNAQATQILDQITQMAGMTQSAMPSVTWDTPEPTMIQTLTAWSQLQPTRTLSPYQETLTARSNFALATGFIHDQTLEAIIQETGVGTYVSPQNQFWGTAFKATNNVEGTRFSSMWTPTAQAPAPPMCH